MSAPVKRAPFGQRAMNGVIVVLAVAAVGLAIALFVVAGEASELKNRKIGKARRDLDALITLKEKVLDLRESLPAGAVLEVPDRPEGLMSLIEKKADENRIGKTFRRIKPAEGRAAEKGWKEFSYTINLQGTKEEKFRRESVLSFLLGIETERPFLRTKRISLEFSDNDIAKMEAIVCYFKREKPAAPKPN